MDRGAAGGSATVRDCPRLTSVIIPALNAARTIGQQLMALAGQTYCGDWEVIVADNGSSDATKSVANEWSSALPRLFIIDASDRKGANFARNAAMNVAGGDLLLFVDADDIVGPGWLQTMCEAAKSFDHFSGRYVDFTEGSSKLVKKQPALFPFKFLPAAWGGNLGVWRDVAEAVGGFNERLVGGAEDVEFSWRVQLLGYSFGEVSESIVFHRRRRSLRGVARQRFLYGKADGQVCVEFANDGIEFAHELTTSWRRIRGLGRGPVTTPEGRRVFVESVCWHCGFMLGWFRGSWERGRRGGRPMRRQ